MDKRLCGDVPKKAIVGGMAADGSPLYICKAFLGDEMCAGKVGASSPKIDMRPLECFEANIPAIYMAFYKTMTN